ncbi:hypothetical protein LBMAG42_01020 [Deltaproteobacteria bacterium]|nr:hypothetical protein LBMAG42_01020 [Deltaproteobacteria bacterium]
MSLRESVIDARNRAGEAIVVCRTGASRRAALAELLTGEGGLENVRVVTLPALVHEGAATPLTARVRALEGLPPAHPWAARLGDRRQLRQRLREHVAEAHRVKALGGDISGLPAELLQLVNAMWGVPDDLPGWPAASLLSPGSIVPFGFEGPEGTTFAGTLTGAGRVLAERLGLLRMFAVPAPVVGLPAVLVSDVGAEARRAALEVEKAASALILVTDAATEDRMRSSLRRNGIQVADPPGANLRHHALAAVLRLLLPVFEARGEDTLTQPDVYTLLTHPVLSRAPRKASLGAVKALGGDRTSRLSTRRFRKLLRGTRRFRDSPAGWVKLFCEAIEGFDRKKVAGPGEGEEPPETSAEVRITAQIALGKLEAIASAAMKGTFAALAEVLGALGLSKPDDPVGNAIRGALRSLGESPVTDELFDSALDGSVDGGRLPEGVAILRYDEYDGRGADVLVLADVHHKGLGAAPGADPFLGSAALAALRCSTPADVVRERLELARWAASRATRCVAVVATHDAGARAVVPPVELDLRFAEPEPPPDSYGLALPLPENAARAELPAGPRVARVAEQVDAEWVRAGFRLVGARPPGAVPEEELKPTLALSLSRDDARPDDLRRWLGFAGDAPESVDGLPKDYVLSATRLERFTTCMYKAYAAEVLRLREPEEMEEDAGARDVGTAAHKVLELAGKERNLRWVVADAELGEARKRLLEATSGAMDAQIQIVRDKEGRHEETPALAGARHGLTRRWGNHWRKYVTTRLTSVSDELLREAPSRRAALLPAAVEAASALIPGVAKSTGEALAGVIARTLAADPSAGALRVALRRPLAKASKPDAATLAAAAEAEFPAVVGALIGQATALRSAASHYASGDGLIIAAEDGAAFGGASDPAAMTLGRGGIAVTGTIDAIVEWLAPAAEAGLEIVDFKTGKAPPGNAAKVLESFAAPQLTFYALAARHELVAAARGKPVRRVAYDMVVSLKNMRHDLVGDVLDRAEATYGALLDRARDGDYPLAPLHDSCPLTGKGYCDFKEACRLRALPGPEDDDVTAQGGVSK